MGTNDSNQLLFNMIQKLESEVKSIKEDTTDIKDQLGNYNVTLALHEKRIVDLEEAKKEEKTDAKEDKKTSIEVKIAAAGLILMTIQAIIQYLIDKL